MKRWLDRYVARYEALARRERWLIVFAVVLALYLGWDLFWFGPLDAENRSLAERNARLEQQVASLRASVTALRARAAQDPNADVRARLERLRAEEARLDGRLGGLRLALIPPHEMSRVLRDMLVRVPGLELVSLRVLPTEVALRAEPEVGDQAAEALVDAPEAEGEPLVFRHPVELRFRGGFHQTLDYVRRLEQLDWRWYWQAVELQTDPETGWPETGIRLRLFTLSVEEGWLGGS